jgi:uncharacterized protein
MERRYIQSREVRASGSSKAPKISGYAAVFNSSTQIDTQNGSFREQIKPGAFTRAIREKDDCVCLFNHNDLYVLGRTSAGTLRLREDENGLFYDCDLPDTQAGRDTHENIRLGNIRGCSFAFTVDADGEDWSEQVDRSGNRFIQRDVRSVSELIDVSPVVHPAYASTSVSARELETVTAELRSGKRKGSTPFVSLDHIRTRMQHNSWEDEIEIARNTMRRKNRLAILDL